MNQEPSLIWNPQVKLILSDVDETVADLYLPATPAMIQQLCVLLEKKISIFFITGQGIESVERRIVHFIPAHLRPQILIGHCSGAEVIGFNSDGTLRNKPFFSIYNQMLSPLQQQTWRAIISQIIKEFHLVVYPTMPVAEFIQETVGNSLAIMYEDRGPQITFEIVHGADDLRYPIAKRANMLFQKANIPIVAGLAGVFAIDFSLKGISKTTAVEFALSSDTVLASLGLIKDDIVSPLSLEIWGDKFSTCRGGTDRYISQSVDPSVRSIDFRVEDPIEFPTGYNILVWNGKKHLHEGLLEYLLS